MAIKDLMEHGMRECICILSLCVALNGFAAAQYDHTGATLTVTVPADAEKEQFDSGYLTLLTGNEVTDFVKEGSGILVMDADISSYTGEIHVNDGFYRFTNADANTKQALGVGALTAASGAITVASGATFEAATDVNCSLGAKRVVASGAGADGRGALLFSGSVNSSSATWGNDITLTDDMLIGSTSEPFYYLNAQPWMGIKMNGHTLSFNHRQDRYVVVQNLKVDAESPGDIVISNAFVFSFQNENILPETPDRRFIVRDRAGFNSHGWRGRYPYTLEWDSTGSIRCNTYSPHSGWAETNRFSWHGPVELKKTLTYSAPTSNGIAHILGPVSGSAGIVLNELSDAKVDRGDTMSLDLWDADNSFAGGVLGRRNNTIRVHANGALPADGGDLVMTNGAFEVVDESGSYSLPKAELAATAGRAVTVNGGTGQWKEVSKHGAGELKYNSLLCAEKLSVHEGTMTLGKSDVNGKYAGLVYGIRECHVASTDDPLGCYNVFSTTECFTNSVELSPHMAYVKDWVGMAYPVMTYRGYIWNRSGETVRWTFASIVNNWSDLFIDRDENGARKKIIHQYNTREVGFATVELTPGPHEFEYRMVCNKSGGANNYGGPAYGSVTNATCAADPTLNWQPRSALMYDPQGRGSTEYADYQSLVDPGDGSLFTWDIPNEDVSAICKHPVTGEESPSVTPAFSEITVAEGALLDAGGIPFMAPATLNGFPKIDNCDELVLAGVWNIGSSDVRAGRRMELSGKLRLTGEFEIVLTNDSERKISSSAPSVIAIAADGIEADLSKVTISAPYACTLGLSEDGKSLLLKRNVVGLAVSIR